MTREEQIVQASVRFNAERNMLNVIGGSAILSEEEFMRFNKNPSFIAGAEWSDENPRKGLVDIDKAVKFLEQWDAYRVCLEGHKEFFIENFKKAMED